MAPSMATFFAFSLLLPIALAMPGAMPWAGPMPTPMGLVATAGFSPKPTDAPGSNGIPQELRRRQDVPFPPPDNWCGFIGGFSDQPLSCSPGLACVFSEQAVGCCTGTTGLCTALYTTCLNYGDLCGSACQRDPAIRKCSDTLEPFCGTYEFADGTANYNCDSTAAVPYSVEFLNDYYVTAISSTLASTTHDVTAALASASGSSLPTSTSSPSSGGSGISAAAIDGIAAAAAILGVAILGVIAFFCVRQRRKRRFAAAAQGTFPNNPPPPQPQPQPQQPMQQQSPPPKAFDGYQSVPQQEQQYPPQYSSSPPQQPPQQQQTGYFPPPGAASTITPQQTGTTDPRYSHAPSILSPQSPVSAPSINNDQRPQSYYKPPLSPAITEVDGTMGNPGVPSGVHGQTNEVDGTMGNPGVLPGGHGIEQQMHPGGSPSATEIDGQGRPVAGQGMGATMNRPFSNDGGVYEMGAGGRS